MLNEIESEQYEREKNLLEFSLMIDLRQTFENDQLVERVAEKTLDLTQLYYWDLSKTWVNASSFTTQKFRQRSVFSLAIADHCILAALYTAKHHLLKNSRVSSFQIRERLGGFGFWAMKDHLRHDGGGYTINKEITMSEPIPTYYSSFFKRLSSISSYGFWKSIFQIEEAKDLRVNIPLAQSDLYYEFVYNGPESRLGWHAKNLNFYKKLSQINKLKGAYNSFLGDLINNRTANIYSDREDFTVQQNPVDQLLLKYQVERIFSPSLMHMILNCWQSNPQNTQNLAAGPEVYNLLTDVNLLPNVFSRDYLVKLMLDALYDPKREQLIQGEPSPNALMYAVSLIDTEVSFASKWREAARQAICQFAFITIPVMEKVFFILLYEHFKTSGCVHPLEAMLDCLYEYAEQHLDCLTYNFVDLIEDNDPPMAHALEKVSLSQSLSEYNNLIKMRTDSHKSSFPVIEFDNMEKALVFKELFTGLFSNLNGTPDQVKLRYQRNFSKAYFGIDQSDITDRFGRSMVNQTLITLSETLKSNASVQVLKNLYGIK
ncbi:MAG: hypothetical protein E7476_11995 [Ruminococcaceae bacterium]|nr:hypothetical protein [Oscillospiraceae bacterium]